MKLTKIILLTVGLGASGVIASELSNEADQKWTAAVEKKIQSAPTTISTPSETRAQAAKQLAQKLGRKAEIQRTESGYRIVVQ